MENVIGFWKPNQVNGEFSQWYECKFVDNGVEYNCAEQYMMAQKALLFGDTKTYKMIMKEKNPSNMKKYGRIIANFDANIWDENKESIVYAGNLLKFAQNEYLRNKLIATGDAELCEASPYDNIWGIGSDDVNVRNGQNLLGNILMNVRALYKIKL